MGPTTIGHSASTGCDSTVHARTPTHTHTPLIIFTPATHRFTNFSFDFGRSVKLLLILANTLNLGFEYRRNPYPYIFFPRLLRVLKCGPFFKEGRDLTTTGYSPSMGVIRAGTHSLTGHFLLSHTHIFQELLYC
jgi:hypothetical protein